MLELYYAPHTCSLVTHIVLEEAGADFKLHLVDFDKNEQPRFKPCPKYRLIPATEAHGV